MKNVTILSLIKDLLTILAEQRITYYFIYNAFGPLGPSCDKNLQGTMTQRPKNVQGTFRGS